MGKKEEINEKETEGHVQLEVNIDSEEKAELLEEFFSSYQFVSNEELRKRLQLEDDDEPRAEPFE